MFSIPRSMNESTSSIRMSPSSFRLARAIRSRSTAMIWRPLHQKADGRLGDRRRGHQHLVLRPVGRRAPLLAAAKDGHGLPIVLGLVRQGVEAGEVRILGFENDVVEVA